MDAHAHGMNSRGLQQARQKMSHKDDKNCWKMTTRSRF
jgi:hypothetical protein